MCKVVFNRLTYRTKLNKIEHSIMFCVTLVDINVDKDIFFASLLIPSFRSIFYQFPSVVATNDLMWDGIAYFERTSELKCMASYRK